MPLRLDLNSTDEIVHTDIADAFNSVLVHPKIKQNLSSFTHHVIPDLHEFLFETQKKAIRQNIHTALFNNMNKLRDNVQSKSVIKLQ